MIVNGVAGGSAPPSDLWMRSTLYVRSPLWSTPTLGVARLGVFQSVPVFSVWGFGVTGAKTFNQPRFQKGTQCLSGGSNWKIGLFQPKTWHGHDMAMREHAVYPQTSFSISPGLTVNNVRISGKKVKTCRKIGKRELRKAMHSPQARRGKVAADPWVHPSSAYAGNHNFLSTDIEHATFFGPRTILRFCSEIDFSRAAGSFMTNISGVSASSDSVQFPTCASLSSVMPSPFSCVPQIGAISRLPLSLSLSLFQVLSWPLNRMFQSD